MYENIFHKSILEPECLNPYGRESGKKEDQQVYYLKTK